MEGNFFRLELPSSGVTGTVSLETGQSVVIVGANGSGKTRLGSWIEFGSTQKDIVHRISAQKSLTMLESYKTSSIEVAERDLYYGYSDADVQINPSIWKSSRRWGQKPNTFPLNDFEKLMIYLFTEDYEKSTEFRRNMLMSGGNQSPPRTKLDTIKRIWESILSHRELVISAGKVQVRVKDYVNIVYSGSEMSDGERVIFYLIGQSLAAPKNGIIIIDEPELHLHKSIQSRLWTEIQSERSDCLFVYLTHDVEFAASQLDAKKIWLKNYDGTNWYWDEVPTVESFPEALLLQILGSRQPVLFVEGDSGSFDVALFRTLYSNHSIVPRGSCSQVINSTRTLRSMPQFHHLEVRGLIDRDRRTSEEIFALAKDGIEVLNVAEVENLFCVPEVLRIVATQFELASDKVLNDVQKLVFDSLSNELDVQISLHVASQVQFMLSRFDVRLKGLSAIKASLESVVNEIDVDAIYSEIKKEFEDVVVHKNYLGALALYNRKSLASRIGAVFGLKDAQLPEYILRLAKGSKRQELIAAFNSHIPHI